MPKFEVYSPDRRRLHYGPWELFSGNSTELVDEFRLLLDTDQPRLVVTPNTDHCLNLERSPQLRSAYDAAALRIIDGAPLAALGRAVGVTTAERQPGADLIDLLCSSREFDGRQILLLGATETTLVTATEALRERFPKVHFNGVPLPLYTNAADSALDEAIAKVQQLSPDVTFVCVGSPKQELLFMERSPQLPPGIYVGAGATADFAAGQMKRAPRWIQAIGMEWGYRLVHEPRRLAHRYLVKGPRFLGVILRSLRHALANRR